MNTKNIKPFDLEAALNGEPVMLRNGQKAFVRHHETEELVRDCDSIWGIVVTDDHGTSERASWSEDGRCSKWLEEYDEDIIGMYPTKKTRIINGFEVPAPEREELKVGDLYFSPGTLFEEFYKKDWWAGGSYELLLLNRGLVFLTKEDAIANAKAMLGINPYEDSEE